MSQSVILKWEEVSKIKLRAFKDVISFKINWIISDKKEGPAFDDTDRHME